MTPERIRKPLTAVLVSAMLALSFLYLLRPVGDPDFFWHLKTGEWIWSHKELPSTDPFSYTAARVTESREHSVLTSYYLSQLFFYLFYSLGGMSGIVAMRFIILGLLVLAVTRRRRDGGLTYQGLLLLFLTLFFGLYVVERPQVFSFLFFAVVLYCLERIRNGDPSAAVNNRRHLLLPAAMLVWANTHPGFIAGQAAIALYLVTEGIKFLHPSLRPTDRKSYRKLALFGLAGIAVSFLNPNTYHVWGDMLLQPRFMTADNVEFQTSYAAFTLFNQKAVVVYWLILFLALCALIFKVRRTDISELALLAGTAVFSFMTTRYIALFAVAALPIIAGGFSGRAAKAVTPLVVGTSLAAALFFGLGQTGNIDNLRSRSWIDGSYPAAAADFIASADPKGNMFNETNWGGYLIWRLAPQRKVFADGRGLDPRIFEQAILVEIAYPGRNRPLPLWKAILRKHDVGYIVIPFAQPDGTLLPLFRALLNDSDWTPVFFSLNSLVFVGNSPSNADLIRRYAISKAYLVQSLTGVCDMFRKQNPEDIFPMIAEGDLYLLQSRFGEAKQLYEAVLATAPYNETARERLQYIAGAQQ